MSRWHNIDGFADLPLGAFQAEQVGLTTRIKLHGGGGGPSETTGTTTSYQSNLPEYAKPYYEEMMARVGEESRTPFEPYTGDQVAPFSAMQQQAQTEVGGMQTPGDISTSRGILGAVGAEAAAAKYDPNLFGSGYVAKPITSGYQAGTFAPSYQAGTVTPGYAAGTMTAPEFNAVQAAKYMSPYQQQVIDVEKREALRQGAQERLGISAAAQQAGAFGGARHGVVEAEQKRNLAQQLGDIQTAGSQQAYDRAAGQFGADRAAQMEAAGQTQGFQQAEGQMGMQAQQATDAQKQYQAQMGMTAQQAQEAAEQAESAAGMTAQQQTEAGRQQQATLGLDAQAKMEQSKQFSAQFKQQARDQQIKVSDAGVKLGQAEQSMNIARTQLQNAVGAEQKDQKQKELDVAEANFTNARDYERQQLRFYSAMLQGQQVPVQREVTQVGPGPNTMTQMAGAGISGLAAMNAFGGKG